MAPRFIIPRFSEVTNISMLQTTRHGGHSKTPFNSLNLSFDVGDDPSDVKKNLNLINKLTYEINWINQVHGDNVIELPSNNMIGDSVFTQEKNVICAVRTADCLPILIANKSATVVAAIHAGWRSIGLGIIEKTIKKIKANSDLYAWLGPSISVQNFEVGEDVYNFYINHDPELFLAFESFGEKYKLSLPLAAIIKLRRYGVKNISGSTIDQNFCTYDDQKNFFSYRRDKNTGRMATMIWINN